MDIQECKIQLESWGHPAHVLRFFWNREDCAVQKSIKLNQHNFQVMLEDQEAGQNFSTGRKKYIFFYFSCSIILQEFNNLSTYFFCS